MTLDQIRDSIYWNSGNATDLDPDTDTSWGGGPVLTWVVNEAQRQIATWKDPITQRQVRFRSLLGELYFKAKVISGTLTSTGTTTTVTLPAADVGDDDDRYNGWILEIGNQMRLVVDYTGSTYTATLHTSLASAPSSGDAYKLYKRFSLLLPSTHAWLANPSGEHISLPATSDIYRAEGNLYEVLKIEDIDNTRVLEKAERTESLPEYLTTTGDPTKWWRFGNKVYFDVSLDEENYYRMEYYRLPTEMSGATDTPEIPEPFHYALVLWGTAWVYRRKQESSDLYSVTKELETFMRNRVGEFDAEMERESGSMSVRLR